MKMSDADGSPGASPFTADMRSYQNSYSFGMPQPGRVWHGDSARYEHNGKRSQRTGLPESSRILHYGRLVVQNEQNFIIILAGASLRPLSERPFRCNIGLLRIVNPPDRKNA